MAVLEAMPTPLPTLPPKPIPLLQLPSKTTAPTDPEVNLNHGLAMLTVEDVPPGVTTREVVTAVGEVDMETVMEEGTLVMKGQVRTVLLSVPLLGCPLSR